MSEQEILEANKLIAEFMGAIVLKEPIGHAQRNIQFLYEVEGIFLHRDYDLKYHISWDWLIPACAKFDSIFFGEDRTDMQQEYIELSDELDFKATSYELIPLFEQLVNCIKWYNSQLVSDK
jgi:hypothetical protein